ncbi:MAG: hypothetical protein OXN84_21335 [Albidovulum sp.]|nr:hypothetical protein [Albidovulum sp.]MDE0531167.1 hypothetical protein [Albidovulum sp.]
MRTTLCELPAGKNPASELKQAIKDLEDVLEIVKTIAKTENSHCRDGDVLPSRERLLLDVIRMLAYRAETRMTLPIIHAKSKRPNTHKLLRTTMIADADIVPNPANRILEMRQFGLGTDA